MSKNWWPTSTEYNPNIDTQTWVELLNDKSIFDYNSMCMMKRFYQFGGEGTVSDIADKYGKSFSAYISISKGLAYRIQKKTNCPMPPQTDNHEKVWPILYQGRDVERGVDNNKVTYIWKLRPELIDALKQINILQKEEYPLIEDNKKWLSLIKRYKKLYSLDKEKALFQEEYKWKTITNCNNKSSLDVIKYLIDIKSNLLDNYAREETKDMLKRPELLEIINNIGDDSIDISERFLIFKNNISKLSNKSRIINDERSFSVILTCLDPENYTFYKDSYYRKLCIYLNEKPVPAGRKYEHYLSLIDDFVTVIKNDDDLLGIFKNDLSSYIFSLKLIAQNIIYVILENEKKELKCIQANISWNSNSWKGFAGDVTNFGYTKIEGNIAMESWNFDFDNPRNTSDTIYGFAQFTHPPKDADSNNFLIVFRSNNQIIGFYANAQILKEYTSNEADQLINIIAQRDLCVLLDNYIDDTDKKYLFGATRIGQINFNYIIRQKYAIDIIEAAKLNNPNQIAELNRIKSWVLTYEEEEESMKINNEIDNCVELLRNTHNLILHGAPGTGKSFLAKEIAKRMCSSDDQIKFVQFHSSYDYTDFVEGLRPITKDGSDQVSFERKDGLFKSFCKQALISQDIDNDARQKMNQSPIIWKVSLQGAHENPTRRDCLDNGWIRLGWYEYGDVEDFNDFEDYRKDIGGKYILRAYQHEMKIGDIVLSCYSATEIDAIGVVTGDYEYNEDGGNYPRYRKVEWLVKDIREKIKDLNNGKKLSSSSIYKMTIPLADVLNIVKKYRDNKIKQDYVFIIDEINRGDLSKIFGELFYSIEPGYRGKKGTVETQYQNLIPREDLFYNGFYVPENIYIIGTMNDIDRSVDSLDFAFRRRFTFKEILANENLGMLTEIKDVATRNKAELKLFALNQAISNISVLSSSYHIGGAYFLKLNELHNDFDLLWEYHINGLVTEYLRGLPNADILLQQIKDSYDKA